MAIPPVRICASTGTGSQVIHRCSGRPPRGHKWRHCPWWRDSSGAVVVRRYYDPATEQFVSVDPLVDETGTPYAFTDGDPVNGSDPSGLYTPCWDALDPLSAGFGQCWSSGYARAGNATLIGVGAVVIGGNAFLGFCRGLAASVNPINLVAPPAGPSPGPKPTPNFEQPTNPPQYPPPVSDLPPGYTIRPGNPTEQYPNGYWRMYNERDQAVDPSTLKPPANVTKAQFEARTHVPLPPR